MELDYVSFEEAKPKLAELEAGLTSHEPPYFLKEEADEILSEVKQMLSLGEKDFSPADFIELEEKAERLVRAIIAAS